MQAGNAAAPGGGSEFSMSSPAAASVSARTSGMVSTEGPVSNR
jgi:hypothetical protein